MARPEFMQIGEPVLVGQKVPTGPPRQRQRQKRLTKDVVVIGWINPQHVTLSTANVGPDVLDFYPVDGVVSAVQKPLTFLHLGWLAFLGPIHPVVTWPLNEEERRYILNWMFKYASNHEPPSGFADESVLEQFVDKSTNYKLFNRFQVAYWVMTEPDEILEETPLVEQAEVAIGVTLEPLWHAERPGEAGPRNGERKLRISPSYQINDGTPERNAVRAFNNLVRGLRWSHIGSLIQHHLSIAPFYDVKMQVYPTYEVYERAPDGTAFVKVRTRDQAPEPGMNFSTNPYPPGPAPFLPSDDDQADQRTDERPPTEPFVPGGGRSGGGGASGRW